MSAAEAAGGLEAAAGRLDWREWSVDRRGRWLKQAVDRSLVLEMIALLDVHPGQRVLEVGTGSGYHTALLALLLAGTGSLVSIDNDPEVVRRVGRRVLAAGIGGVRLHAADGREGWPADAPYHRIISWAAAPVPPVPWREQLAGDGIVVLPAPGPPAVVRRLVRRSGELIEEVAIPGAFVPLGDAPPAPNRFRPLR